MAINSIISRFITNNISQADASPGREKSVMDSVNVIWKKAGFIFFADEAKVVKSLLAKLAQPEGKITQGDIKNTLNQLKGLFKAGYDSCLSEPEKNNFLFSTMDGAKLFKVTLRANRCYVDFPLPKNAGYNSFIYDCTDHIDIQHQAVQQEKISDDNAINNDKNISGVSIEDKNGPGCLEAINLWQGFTSNEKAHRIARLTKYIFENGLGSTNKPNDKVSSAEMERRWNILKGLRGRGVNTTDYFKAFIKDGLGNCQEQAAVAHLICHYNGIDNQLLEVEDARLASHMACRVNFDDEQYIIDPWADIIVDVTNKNSSEYLQKLEERFLQWHEKETQGQANPPKYAPKYFSVLGAHQKLRIGHETYLELQTAINNKIEEIHSRPSFG